MDNDSIYHSPYLINTHVLSAGVGYEEGFVVRVVDWRTFKGNVERSGMRMPYCLYRKMLQPPPWQSTGEFDYRGRGRTHEVGVADVVFLRNISMLRTLRWGR